MATSQPQSTGGLVVSPDTEKAFGPLISLIRKSESMNEDERQYWVNILPTMTPEQVQNLQDILVNEQKQLAAIDAKYSKELDSASQQEVVKKTTEARRSKREERATKEAAHRQEEEKTADTLLSQIEEGM